MTTNNTNIYTRNARGDWYRNGRPTHNPPKRIVEIAQNMALECRIVDRKPR